MSQSGRKQPPMRDAYLPDALHEGTEKTPVRVFQRPGAPQADSSRPDVSGPVHEWVPFET
jgi:hypothetical protein